MTDCFEDTLFIRHGRCLQALMLESQAWFCVRDLGRLMGYPLNERSTQKLDPDQQRTVWLFSNGEWTKSLMVSESGAFALLVHHYVPENRALRQWLTHEVLPALRDSPQDHHPSMTQLKWLGTSLSLLHWQSEPWIRLRDMPDVLSSSHLETTPPPHSWWRRMLGTLQLR
jgi:prophage antirepressor-like protein